MTDFKEEAAFEQEALLPPGSPPLPAVERFATSDGYEHAFRLWSPGSSTRGLIVCLHGIQSHAGWYGYSSQRLADAGYAVAYLDRRGSGANAVARGDTPNAERLINDVVQLVAALERNGLSGLPRVLSAVSWGGKLAVATAARRPELFDGLALLTPGLKTLIRARRMQRFAVRFGTAVGEGQRTIPIPLDDPALFTDSPDDREFIRNDPLTLRRVSVRFLQAGLTLDRIVREESTNVRVPTLLMLAGRDRIVNNSATRRLVGSFRSKVKTLMECETACHTLEFEPNREEIFSDLIEWLDRTVGEMRRR